MPDALARAFGDPGLRADHRHPRTDLAVEPCVEIGGVGLDSRQAGAKEAQRVKGRALGQRLTIDRADVFDRVIDGADAGRQKQPFGVGTLAAGSRITVRGIICG
jgi:hypothetical protein